MRLALLVLLVLTSLGFSQSVPWPTAERLTYQLSWQGVSVGKFYLSASPMDGGWKFRGRLETQGIAAVSGYGLEADSTVGPDFYDDTFWRNLTEPLKGTTRLTFARVEDGGSSAKVTEPSGKVSGWFSPIEQVLDELSLIYYARLHPEVRAVNLVDYSQLSQGTLEVFKNGDLTVYRFAREGLLVEVWYRPDTRRTPVKIIFGRDFGRLEGTLLEPK
ncbi:MAG: DUF3108 domain-containing protein [Thermaceae bacterium]|nr:DUF3108 domain-containing protein [Thermaceae bacterium]